MGPSRRRPHELEIEVRSADDGPLEAGVAYSGSYIPVSLDSGPGRPHDVEPICMFCHAPAPTWIVEFRESDDPSYGHVRAAGCCERCHALVDAGDWRQLTVIHADFISGGKPLAEIDVSRAEHLYTRTRAR